MPAASHIREQMKEAGVSDFQAELLKHVVSAWGGRILDCRAVLPDEAFYDADHLKVGALRSAFSTALGEAVARGMRTCPRGP
jgi:hypothetical protein